MAALKRCMMCDLVMKSEILAKARFLAMAIN